MPSDHLDITPDPRPERAKPRALRTRSVVVLLLAWTVAMAGWFGWYAIRGDLATVAVGLAVGGLVGGVWLMGALVLALFLITPAD